MLCPSGGNRANNVPGDLDIDGSDDHAQKEAFLENPPHEKEVEKVFHIPDELGKAKGRVAQR